MTTLPSPPVEIDVLTARTKATWTAGDFGKIAQSYTPGAASTSLPTVEAYSFYRTHTSKQTAKRTG